MQTERVTFLASPNEKASLMRRAAGMGVSNSEFVRRAVENFDEISALEEAELAALVEQVNEAIPKMQASFTHISHTLETLHEEMDAFLHEKGIRS